MSKSPSKCKSVKNPCKICYQTVKPKNGLQCLGACEAWVHYQCLNYTPGKIYDIKKGLIEITCPCPDCEDGKSKELRTDALYSVENIAYVNEGYKTDARNIRPLSVVPSYSITECTEYSSEYMTTPVQQIRGPVSQTNQCVPLKVQPKPNGIDMEQVMGTISELSHRLQGLMTQIQRKPGFYSPSPAALSHVQVQPKQSQERNSAVVEWTCNEPSSNDLRNQSTTSTQEETDLVKPQQGPTVVNQFVIYGQQPKKPINGFTIKNKRCH